MFTPQTFFGDIIIKVFRYFCVTAYMVYDRGMMDKLNRPYHFRDS